VGTYMCILRICSLPNWVPKSETPARQHPTVILMPLAFLMEHHSTQPSMIIKVIRT